MGRERGTHFFRCKGMLNADEEGEVGLVRELVSKEKGERERVERA